MYNKMHQAVHSEALSFAEYQVVSSLNVFHTVPVIRVEDSRPSAGALTRTDRRSCKLIG